MQQKEKEFSLKQFFAPITTLKAIHFIIIIGIVVFFLSLFNGFVGDDEAQLVMNPLVHSIKNIPYLFLGSTFNLGSVVNIGLYYKPLTSSFFAVVYSVFGANPMPFHLFQLFLHVINAILIFFIFRYFFNINIATFLALVFVVHPINVETVVYISDLQDILFFFFGSLALYLDLRLKDNLKKIIWVSTLLLLSIFSKESGVLFMGAVLGYEIFFRRHKVKQILLVNALILGIYTFFRILIARISFITDTSSPIMHIALGERLLNIPSILLYYFKTAFFPLQLAVAQVWLIDTKNLSEFYFATFIIGIIIAAFVLIGIFIFIKRRRDFRLYAFFIFLLGIGLLLHSQIFFTLDGTVADRWFYFPLVGLLGIIGVLLHVLTTKLKAIPNSIIILIVVAILGALSIRSIIRSTNFYNNYTLASHDIQYSKDSSLLASLLGRELMDRGQYKEAESYFLKSVKLDPKGQVVWNLLGVYYEAVGQVEKAQQAYTTAIKNGASLEAYHNLALLLFMTDQLESAEKMAQEGLQKFPANGQLWQLYTLIEHKLGHEDIALNAAKRAVLYNPTPLTSTIYTRLLNKLSVDIKTIPSTGKAKKIQICLPNCE